MIIQYKTFYANSRKAQEADYTNSKCYDNNNTNKTYSINKTSVKTSDQTFHSLMHFVEGQRRQTVSL